MHHLCQHVLNCVGRPQRLVPYSGNFEAEHQEWNWHCLHRVEVRHEEEEEETNDSNAHPTGKPLHPAVQAVQSLQEAVDANPEWLDTIVATLSPVYTHQAMMVSTQEQQASSKEEDDDDGDATAHPRPTEHHAKSVARRRRERQEPPPHHQGRRRATETTSTTNEKPGQERSNDPRLWEQEDFFFGHQYLCRLEVAHRTQCVGSPGITSDFTRHVQFRMASRPTSRFGIQSMGQH